MPVQPLALQPSEADGAVIEFTDSDDRVNAASKCSILKQLADNVDGVAMTLLDFTSARPAELERLVLLGAVTNSVDDFGDETYSLNIEGVSARLCIQVVACVGDVFFERKSQVSGDWTSISKVEAAYMLMAEGFRPVNRLSVDDIMLGPASDLQFLVPNILKSIKYFQVLLQRASVFSKGLDMICQRAPHFYYECLLQMEFLNRFNALLNISRMADNEFKLMLKDGGLDIEDELVDEDELEGPIEVVPLLVVPFLVVPKAPAIVRPAHLDPKHWTFSCGAAVFNIHIDGFSHQSGVRRAYGKCPCPGHRDCFKYVHLSTVDHTWEAIAFILAFARKGLLASDKTEHRAMELPTAAEIEFLKDEMPVELLVDALVVLG